MIFGFGQLRCSHALKYGNNSSVNSSDPVLLQDFVAGTAFVTKLMMS